MNLPPGGKDRIRRFLNLSDKFSDTLILAPKTPDTRNSGHEYYCNMYNHKYVNGVRGEHPLMLRGLFNASRNIICNDNLVKRYNADICLLNKKTKKENFKDNHNVILMLSPGIRDILRVGELRTGHEDGLSKNQTGKIPEVK